MTRRPLPQHPFSAETWQRALAEIKLVVAIAKDYRGRGLDRDDLVQEGLIGVCRAAETFDGERGQWPDHAGRYARNAMKRAIYRGQLVRRPWLVLWGARPARSRVHTHNRVLAIFPARDARLPPRDWAEAMAAIAGLDEQERRVIAGRYGLDGPKRTYRELGAELGVHQTRVGQIERRAVARLRKAAGGTEG